jgi:hypothetical protein
MVMPLLMDLTYGVEGNWRLMWFPIRSTPHLEGVHVRTNFFRLTRSQVPPPHDGWISSTGLSLGQGADPGEKLHPYQMIVAMLTIGSGLSGYLEAEVEIHLGRASRRTRFLAKPETQTPFLLSVLARPDDEELTDTAAVVDGVLTTGGRLGFSDVVTHLLRP